MIKKIFTALLLILLFLIILSKISNSFDGDFGWHLRFGQDAAAGNFQYTDSYTWGNYGVKWVNHEWGGDILFWQIYQHFGYYWLIILTSLAVTIAFYLSTKIYQKKVTIPSLVIAIILTKNITYILVMRLAMFSLLFFSLIWLTLERFPQKKYYYLWPIIFWIWAALHGGWILGFITINIYLGANILQNIINKYYNEFPSSNWKLKDFFKIIGAQILSLLTILINPYGYKIYTEVLTYFSQSYYKTHITEWVGSYVFPIFWQSLIISALAVFFALLLFKNKKIGFAQLLLVIAFFISGFMYKRNAIFSVLVGVPIMIASWNWLTEIIEKQKPDWIRTSQDKIIKNTIQIFGGLMIIFLIFFYGLYVKIYNTPWEQRALLIKNLMPYDAIQFLKKETANKPYKIFNEFSWGGYMNWELKNSLVYFDGRGTATWMSPETPGRSMLEEYYHYKYGKNYLPKIEKQGVSYILLQNIKLIPYSSPDKINNLLFGNELKKIYSPEVSQLEIDLRNSKNWQLIYSDSMANIWKNLTMR